MSVSGETASGPAGVGSPPSPTCTGIWTRRSSCPSATSCSSPATSARTRTTGPCFSAAGLRTRSRRGSTRFPPATSSASPEIMTASTPGPSRRSRRSLPWTYLQDSSFRQHGRPAWRTGRKREPSKKKRTPTTSSTSVSTATTASLAHGGHLACEQTTVVQNATLTHGWPAPPTPPRHRHRNLRRRRRYRRRLRSPTSNTSFARSPADLGMEPPPAALG